MHNRLSMVVFCRQIYFESSHESSQCLDVSKCANVMDQLGSLVEIYDKIIDRKFSCAGHNDDREKRTLNYWVSNIDLYWLIFVILTFTVMLRYHLSWKYFVNLRSVSRHTPSFIILKCLYRIFIVILLIETHFFELLFLVQILDFVDIIFAATVTTIAWLCVFVHQFCYS